MTQAPSGERPRRSAAGAAPRGTASAGATLICTAGPAAGQEFTLVPGGETVVGRAAEATVSVADTSVSRRHLQLTKGPRGWVASDLGSGNGTFVNGEKLEAEHVLANGDVITLGDTEFSFADGGAPARAAARPVAAVQRAPEGGPLRRADGSAVPVRGSRPRPERVRPGRAMPAANDPEAQKRKKKILIGAGAGGGVLLILLIALMVHRSAVAEREAAEAAELQQRRAQVATIFQDGKNAVREGDWKAAKVKFEEVLELAPNYPTVADYLQHAEREIPNQENLTAAEAALAKNELATAAAALAKVSQNTQQDQRLRSARTALEQKIPAKVLEARNILDGAAVQGKSDKEGATEKTKEALALLADVLGAEPENRDAKSLDEIGKDQLDRLTRPVYVPPPPRKDPWENAVRRFMDGDSQGAVTLLDDCTRKVSKCRTIQRQMREFNELYKRVESLDGRSLQRLMTLDTQITSGKGSVLIRKVGTRIANDQYRRASAAKSAGQWSKAADYAKQALKADPNHAGARGILAEAKSKSSDIYLQCYSLKDIQPDKALECFHDFMRMAGPEHPKYDSAKNWAEKLTR